MRVYIAGPMRGYPGFNFDEFDSVKEHLIACGYDVVSPADSDRAAYPDHDFSTGRYPEGFDIEKVLANDFIDVASCDIIYLLNGWEKSVGAKQELGVALACSKKVIVQ